MFPGPIPNRIDDGILGPGFPTEVFNVLVMGPGGYEFQDYWRMGLPLEILIILVSVPMIVLVWPLTG